MVLDSEIANRTRTPLTKKRTKLKSWFQDFTSKNISNTKRHMTGITGMSPTRVLIKFLPLVAILSWRWLTTLSHDVMSCETRHTTTLRDRFKLAKQRCETCFAKSWQALTLCRNCELVSYRRSYHESSTAKFAWSLFGLRFTKLSCNSLQHVINIVMIVV